MDERAKGNKLEGMMDTRKIKKKKIKRKVDVHKQER